MIFQEMTKEDLPQIVKLESLCFQEPWKEKECIYEIDENPFSHGWVLKNKEEIVAYAFLWETYEMAQLARIGVNPMHRKQGLGKELLKHLCQRAKDAQCEYMTLEVRESNVAALALYASFDFIQVNISKGYYSNGENAIVLTKAL